MKTEIWHVITVDFESNILNIQSFGSKVSAEEYFMSNYSFDGDSPVLHSDGESWVYLISSSYECH